MDQYHPQKDDLRFYREPFQAQVIDGNIDLHAFFKVFEKAMMGQLKNFSLEPNEEFVYVILRGEMKVLAPILEGEDCTLVTFPLYPQALELYREAYVLNSKGEPVIILHTLWVLVNPKTRRIMPSKPLLAFFSRYPFVKELTPLLFGRLKRMEEPEEKNPVSSYTVPLSDIDANKHMNNTCYLRVSQSMGMKPFSRLLFEFEKECYLNEKLSLEKREEEDKDTYVLRKEDGSLSFLLSAFH
ncbi:MAG: hypothetical protein WCS91_01215 [Bacilli bacterium]